MNIRFFGYFGVLSIAMTSAAAQNVPKEFLPSPPPSNDLQRALLSPPPPLHVPTTQGAVIPLFDQSNHRMPMPSGAAGAVIHNDVVISGHVEHTRSAGTSASVNVTFPTEAKRD
jgi:hypothetical protein